MYIQTLLQTFELKEKIGKLQVYLHLHVTSMPSIVATLRIEGVDLIIIKSL